MKNCLTLGVSVARNVFIKFGFDSVNGSRKTYFVDAIHRFCLDFDLFKPDEIGKWRHDFLADICDFIRQNFILGGAQLFP